MVAQAEKDEKDHAEATEARATAEASLTAIKETEARAKGAADMAQERNNVTQVGQEGQSREE